VLPPESDPVEVAFLPSLGDVELRLTVREGAPDEAEAWLDRVEGEVAPLVEPYRYRAAESGSVVEAVAARLVASGRTVAVAESCTGGLLGARLTDRAGASGYFLGGIIAYADEVKVRELGVAPEVLEEHGAVSAQTARAMARGVARRFGSDVGLAITGIAGPGGGTAAKPVGTVWYAISVGERSEAHEGRFPGGREQIRERSVQAALALILGETKVD
jgi:nicotinamide-nucleotide amidase